MFARITKSCSVHSKKSSLANKTGKIVCFALCTWCMSLSLSLSLHFCVLRVVRCSLFKPLDLNYRYMRMHLARLLWTHKHTHTLSHTQTNTLTRSRPYVHISCQTKSNITRMLSPNRIFWVRVCVSAWESAVVFLWFCYCIHARIASIRFGRFRHRYSV